MVSGEGQGSKDWRPVPDPTTLTSEALEREAETLRRELQWIRDYFKQEIDLLRETYTVKIEAVIQTSNERFARVKEQFHLVETARLEQKEDTKAAVDAALTAQKEAVREQTIASQTAIDKSSAAMAKQLDQQSVTFSTALEGLRREDNDIRERLTRIENQKLGGEAKLGSIYALAGFILVVLLITTGFITIVN